MYYYILVFQLFLYFLAFLSQILLWFMFCFHADYSFFHNLAWIIINRQIPYLRFWAYVRRKSKFDNQVFASGVICL